jgi:hypothetical protein
MAPRRPVRRRGPLWGDPHRAGARRGRPVHMFTMRKATAALIGAAALLAPGLARSGEPMTYVYNAPESPGDVRYEYHWEILRSALERTVAAWGPYRLVASDRMPERRQALELERANGGLTVMYLSTTPELERKLHPIRIPVDRDLGGYCVFLIRSEDRDRFARVQTLDDLRGFTFGLGHGWIDVGILEASGLKVVTGTSYEGLFEMLERGRFDVFLRAATEVLDERQRRDWLPGLFVEERLLLFYPLPMYFWFSRTDEGRRLAARAEEGMRAMIADGTYDAIFDRYQRRKILALRLRERVLIRIPNPNLGPETPFADKRLWFDPRTYR